MHIRLATRQDIPGILSLLKQVGQVHHEIRPDIFPPETLKYDASALEALLQDSSRPIFLAVEDAFVLGYCFCVHKDHEGSGVSTRRRELYIDDLCVDRDCRGKGVATALYHHVLGYAREQGIQFLTLNVWWGNHNALKFYEKMGMRPRIITMETPLEDDRC